MYSVGQDCEDLIMNYKNDLEINEELNKLKTKLIDELTKKIRFYENIDQKKNINKNINQLELTFDKIKTQFYHDEVIGISLVRGRDSIIKFTISKDKNCCFFIKRKIKINSIEVFKYSKLSIVFYKEDKNRNNILN